MADERLVNDQLLNALSRRESGGNVKAVGDTNLQNQAFGEFQIRLPAFQDVQRISPEQFGGESFERVKTDPQFNRSVTISFLDALENTYGLETQEAILGGFNAGPTRARQFQNQGRPFPTSTQEYIADIMRFMQEQQELPQ